MTNHLIRPHGLNPSEIADNSGEGSLEIASSSFVSLDAHWDGIFPPRPPPIEDLIVTDMTEAESVDVDGTSTTQIPTQQPKSGHGDWTENTVNSESEFITVGEPGPNS